MSAMHTVLLIVALAVVGFVARYRDRAKDLEGQLQRNADRADEGTEKNP